MYGHLKHLKLKVSLHHSVALPHHFINIKMQRYYQNQLRFKGFYSRSNLPKNGKDGQHVINLNECDKIWRHWAACCIKNNDAT